MKIYELFFKPQCLSIGVFTTLFKAKEFAEKFITGIRWKRANDYLVADCLQFEVIEREMDAVTEIDVAEITEFFGTLYDDN